MAISTPAVLRRKRARLADSIAECLSSLHNVSGAELPRRVHLSVVLDDRDHFVAGKSGHMENHEAERPSADHGNGVTGARARIFKAMDSAGKRLCKRGVLERHVWSGTLSVFLATMRAGMRMNSA